MIWYFWKKNVADKIGLRISWDREHVLNFANKTRDVVLHSGWRAVHVFILEPASASLREPTHALQRVSFIFITSD